MDTWRNYGEYALRALSADNLMMTTAVFSAAAVIGLMLYYNSPWHVERAVSKRKIKARHRKVRELVDGAITEALEDSHRRGILKRHEVDYHYDILRRAGYKEIGPEPSFGRPWYYGPKTDFDLSALKLAITRRLADAGVAIHSKLSRRVLPAQTKKQELLAALKLKKAIS